MADTPESYKEWFEMEKRYLRKNIKSRTDVLEVGCGDGRSLSYLENKQLLLVGIDNDSSAVELARKNFQGNSPPSFFMYGDGKNIPFKRPRFDYVLSMTTPANFGKDRNKFYSEMQRVLRDNGEIILSVYNEDAFEERMKLYKKLGVPKENVFGTTVIFNDLISEQFSQSQLEKIFKENNLTPIEISKQGLGYFCRLEKR